MSIPKVLVIIINHDKVEPACLKSVQEIDYPNFNVLIHTKASRMVNANVQMNKSDNSALNRVEAGKAFLKTDAEYALFLDSDTVVPRNVLTDLVKRNKDIIGGWCQLINKTAWVGGHFKNNVISRYKRPVNGLISVGMASFGCLLLSRKVVENVPLKDGGTNRECVNEMGDRCYWGPCLAFTQKAIENGFEAFLDGDVRCKHIIRETGEQIGDDNMTDEQIALLSVASKVKSCTGQMANMLVMLEAQLGRAKNPQDTVAIDDGRATLIAKLGAEAILTDLEKAIANMNDWATGALKQ